MTYAQAKLLRNDQIPMLCRANRLMYHPNSAVRVVEFSGRILDPGEQFSAFLVNGARTLELYIPCCHTPRRYEHFKRRLGFVAAMAGARIKHTREYTWVVNLPEEAHQHSLRIAYLMALQVLELLENDSLLAA